MQYKILSYNDDGTALVAMTVEDHTLNENFAIGESPDELADNIKVGLERFQAAIDILPKTPDTNDYTDLVDQPVTVSASDLPTPEVTEES